MASIYAALRQLVGNDADVKALVPIDRIQMFQNTSTTLPGIVIYSPSGAMSDSLETGSSYPWDRRVSFDCRGNTYEEADKVGEAVIKKLNGFQGIQDGWFIDRCHVIGDVPLSEEGVAVRRRVIDFRVVYQPNN